jgi:ATP-dependent DNA ligase
MLYKILAMPSAIDTDFSQVQFGEKDFETIINALEHVHILPWSLAYTFQDIISYFDLWYALGAEGVIVKNLNSYYKYSSGGKRGGKIAPWWKFKIQDYKLVKGDTTASEYTVKITGCYYGEANAKYRYSLGGFHYKGVAEYKGEKVSIIGRCGGGFTDEQRDDFIKRQNEFPGMIIDIVSQEVTLNKEGKHSLRFPIFKCFRPDLTNIDEN